MQAKQLTQSPSREIQASVFLRLSGDYSVQPGLRATLEIKVIVRFTFSQHPLHYFVCVCVCVCVYVCVCNERLLIGHFSHDD